ncbi:related to SNF2 family helicase/ATPase [Ustilago trichophora]|uniref:Related to SNF2 family helicase/ATPase n=1 Tax=Ustilago trichophora TaxID=86804 RepID=A0A5C3DRF8_9BASI|nr:related to SNF2 family helicase/ATPase [Ustilago trichophora]
MVALTRSKVAAKEYGTASPSSTGSTDGRSSGTGRKSNAKDTLSASPKASVSSDHVEDGTSSETKAKRLPDVPTIPLFDFDLPLELDAPNGSRASAFKPASYESLRLKLEQWFPDLSRQDEEPKDAPSHPIEANAASSQVVGSQSDTSIKTRRGRDIASSARSTGQAQQVPKQARQARQSQCKGKTKQTDYVYLEVEFVPQLLSDNDLDLQRPRFDHTDPWRRPRPHQAYAVVALAPPDYRPIRARSKATPKSREAAEARHETTSASDDDDDDEDELDTLLLGHVVPSAFKDTAHPLVKLDAALLTKDWIQLYGEVTLVPPFLPPKSEVFGSDASQTSSKRAATTPAASSSTAIKAGSDLAWLLPPVKSEPDVTSLESPVKAEPGLESSKGSDQCEALDTKPEINTRPGVPSTRLLGVLSVQVGLEPAALQYGAGDTKVDGFVESNEDLKNTGLEGCLNLARSLRETIPAIVDWEHGFIEIDMQAHTYWDRNESFYDLPPKQSTLARHLVLDKIDAVDLPTSAKSPSKKRKKSTRASSSIHNETGYGSDEDDFCLHCQCMRCAAPPPSESSRPKPTGPPSREKISATDTRFGDPTSEKFLPLDTNIASLLEGCRPRPDGPQVYPPSDMIPTPLLGYQARCLAWMIKKETVVDEDVRHLMPNWFPLRCKSAVDIMRRRLQLEAEREAHLDAMRRGLSRSRRNVKVKAAQAGVVAASTASQSDGITTDGQHGATLKREPFIDPVDQPFYFDQVSGLLSLRRFCCRPSEPGGALCESMGLGKTLESLSLIAAHPRPSKADLLSYDTSRSARMIAELRPNERPFVSRATLVVCPAALVEQWMDEIRKHFRSRNTSDLDMSDDADASQQPGVVRYRHADFKWNAGSSRLDVRMEAKARLTQPDIVVATYEELAFQLSESRRVPRDGNQVRTPLLEVLFWRIILDEAQIVAGASSKATDMIHELWRSNCWMVTGTPVTKGISDIQGIFAFLDHDPLAAPRFFREILENPFRLGCVEGIRRMRSILPRFVWRHTQAHVEEEIVLPPCKSELLEIDLKHVERLFYDKEVNKYREMFVKRAAQGVATVSQPTFLVQLRQLLSHPQIADQLMFSNNYTRLSFFELLRQFCQQAQSELESIRMQLVTNALQLVWGHDFFEAEEDKRRWRGGRRVLENPDDIRKVLNAALQVVNKALEDQSLARAEALARLQGKEQDVTMEDNATSTQSAEIDVDIVAPTDANANAEAAAEASTSKSRVESVDQQAWGGTDSAVRINLTWEEASYWLRTLLQKHADPSTGELANDSAGRIEPPARWDPERPTRTFFEKEFKNANDKRVDLKDPRFHLVIQDAGEEDMEEDDLIAQIEAERLGKGSSEGSKKKQKKLEPGLLKKSRLRGNANQRKQARVWLYKPKERLETTHARLLSQQSKLPSKQTEVTFLREQLQDLQKSETIANPNDEANASDPDRQDSVTDCKVCFDPKEQIGVLPCYHSFCIDCIETICKNSSRVSNAWYDERPRCPACRLVFHPDRVTRVMKRGRAASTEDDDEVVGDWSGKITGLILDLKARLRKDATHKAVIFSHWPKMLAYVRDALWQNDIQAVVFGGKEATQAEALRAIRDDDHVNVIMVPFRATSGAAGLTLTCCDLAYLMEPALDAALEAQAIGRIHRIGQRRETTIIRVKMKDTVEDAVMRIADERSRRGMALATHADSIAAAAPEARVEGANTSAAAAAAAAAAESSTSSTGPASGTSGEAIPPGITHVEAAASGSGQKASPMSSLRERSIKSSVAASVGAARDSDNTSLTMAEVGLILGFDIDEEKRKARERRESLMDRAYRYGVTGYWVNRFGEEDFDELERDLAMYDDDEDLDDNDDDFDEDGWPRPDMPGAELPNDRLDEPESGDATVEQPVTIVQAIVEVPQANDNPAP